MSHAQARDIRRRDEQSHVADFSVNDTLDLNWVRSNHVTPPVIFHSSNISWPQIGAINIHVFKYWAYYSPIDA